MNNRKQILFFVFALLLIASLTTKVHAQHDGFLSPEVIESLKAEKRVLENYTAWFRSHQPSPVCDDRYNYFGMIGGITFYESSLADFPNAPHRNRNYQRLMNVDLGTGIWRVETQSEDLQGKEAGDCYLSLAKVSTRLRRIYFLVNLSIDR